MSWDEFSTLLAGLMADTPLGQVVSIRSETDKEILKGFTKEQHRIRREWQNRRISSMDEDEARRQVRNIQMAFKAAFSKND
jgi:hypothetical protein